MFGKQMCPEPTLTMGHREDFEPRDLTPPCLSHLVQIKLQLSGYGSLPGAGTLPTFL